MNHLLQPSIFLSLLHTPKLPAACRTSHQACPISTSLELQIWRCHHAIFAMPASATAKSFKPLLCPSQHSRLCCVTKFPQLQTLKEFDQKVFSSCHFNQFYPHLARPLPESLSGLKRWQRGVIIDVCQRGMEQISSSLCIHDISL